MKTVSDITDLSAFPAKSGAVRIKDLICKAGKGREFISAMSMYFPKGISEHKLNDLLWFEPKFCLGLVGLSDPLDD